MAAPFSLCVYDPTPSAPAVAQVNEIRVDNRGMTEKAIIIGGGGHALSLADATHGQQLEVVGFIAPTAADPVRALLPCLGHELAAADFAPDAVLLLNGIGSSGPVSRHRSAYLEAREAGWRFARVAHRNASVSGIQVTQGDACQVMANAVINAGVALGDNVLVNSGAVVEHGCQIGSHSHVASGAIVCGDCRLGESVHIGAGATVLPGVRVGSGAVIAAGAVVTADVEPLTLVAGVPARRLRAIDEQELA